AGASYGACGSRGAGGSALGLVRRGLLLDRAEPGEVELAAAGEVDHAVLLLEHVGHLRVAVAEHQRVLEQHAGEPLEAGIELLLAGDPLAVAPGLGGVVPGARRLGRLLRLLLVPPDAAVLRDEVGLAGEGQGELAVGEGVLVRGQAAAVGEGAALAEPGLLGADPLGALLVGGGVVDFGAAPPG